MYCSFSLPLISLIATARLDCKLDAVTVFVDEEGPKHKSPTEKRRTKLARKIQKATAKYWQVLARRKMKDSQRNINLRQSRCLSYRQRDTGENH